MPVTEYERNELFGWFEEHMGKERAATMMSLLPPVGWADVATKRDLDVAVQRLDAKIDVVAAQLTGRIDVVEVRLDSLAEQTATKADLQELGAGLQRTFVTWLLTAHGAVVAAVGLLLLALR
jgi:hypothetical protein